MISISDILAQSWRDFKNSPWVLIATGLLIYFYIMFMSLLPIAGLFILMLTTPSLWGGLINLANKITKNDDPQIGHVIDGFKRFFPVLGFVILYHLAGLALMYPSLKYLYEVFNKYGELIGYREFLNVVIYLFLNGCLVSLIFSRFVFVIYILMDDFTISLEDAAKQSLKITKGYSLRLIFLLGLLYIMIAVGFVLLLVPGLIATMFALVVLSVTYYKLKVIAEQQAIYPEVT